MKKLIFGLISMLLIIPSSVSAHTELTSSNPSAEQVVAEELKEISLTFGGEIESLSTMTLLREGQEISFTGITLQEDQMIGKLSQPLENGTYILQWSIAGEDGHPITGNIPFSVQLPEEETKDTSIVKQKTIMESAAEEEREVATDRDTNRNNLITTILPMLAVLLLVVGLVNLYRKKT